MVQGAKRGGMMNLLQELRATGFRGEIETDRALLAAMSTDNSVYQIAPDLVAAPLDAQDVVRACRLDVALTPRGGGTGTNGQSLNRGLVLDMRRHMSRLLAVNVTEGWADVEPGMVLDDLNDQLRPHGLFFAPETSTSTRCTIGGMVSTDASGKGSRVYGKTSDNIVGLDIARAEGQISSFAPLPDWAKTWMVEAEAAARKGRDAFVTATPRLNRRFTGYDLERACGESFEWWRLFLGAEGTLGPITRIRVKLRQIEAEKRLLVVGFDSFRNALAAAQPLLAVDPTAVEVMDETVQAIAQKAGVLAGLPESLQTGEPTAYTFIEVNGDDPAEVASRLAACRAVLRRLPGAGAIHEAAERDEIRRLWAIRSAGVGLLGKVDGPARPVAFVEDCVVPPENLPAFIDDFLAVLAENGLGFGMYGHVDVGCLHIRPALNIDSEADRARLVTVSDAVFALTKKHGGIFWGEHGKGVRGAYLRDWIGAEAYDALRAVKAAFDPKGRFNPGKLVGDAVMGIADTPFRPFNAPDGDPLNRAFRCNGNAQCLSYQATTPMCPSFKATADLRQSPKGRADALRDWHRGGRDPQLEPDLLRALDTCLGCKACATSCPVQVDIPSMKSAFLAEYHIRNARPFADRLTLWAERHSARVVRAAPLLRPLWPLAARIGETLTATRDLPNLNPARLDPTPGEEVILVQDWFTALFDGDTVADIAAGLRALGYAPRLLPMRPAGKAAWAMGDRKGFAHMAAALVAQLQAEKAPLIGLDPALVMLLRQDYPKAGFAPPPVLLPQEFLAAEIDRGRTFPKGKGRLKILSHCTEATGAPTTVLWAKVAGALGLTPETPATGCCGMAGLFGHQERHQEMSRTLFDMSWADKLDGATATGFSCRCQAERLTKTRLRHPLGRIAELIQDGSRDPAIA